MRTVRNTLVLATAVIALGACAKKAPPELPPAPGPAVDNSQGQDNSGVGNVAVPGSQADFLAKVRSDRILFDLDRYNVDADDQITPGSAATTVSLTDTTLSLTVGSTAMSARGAVANMMSVKSEATMTKETVMLDTWYPTYLLATSSLNLARLKK